MPDWGAIFENRANYPGVKMQKLLGGTPALLSCSAVFAQLTAECPSTLQWAASSIPQNCPYRWGIWTPSNTWFLGPPENLTQTPSQSVEPFLQAH